MSHHASKAATKLNFSRAVGESGAPIFIQWDNVIDLIIHDHNEVKGMYEKYKSSTEQHDKKRICHLLIKTLLLHDEIEQLLLYPLVKAKLADKGGVYYHECLDEHQELRNILYQVQQANSQHGEEAHVDKELGAAMATVLDHVKKEETQVLPLLKKHVSEDELKKVGTSFKAYKLTAVAGPDPDAPSQGHPADVTMKPFDLVEGLTV